MPKTITAIWNGTTIAETDQPVVIEGNYYFPPDAVEMSLLEKVSQTTMCPWKGTASYYDIVVDEKRNEAAAWTYLEPKPTAISSVGDFTGYIAFWNGVEVTEQS